MNTYFKILSLALITFNLYGAATDTIQTETDTGMDDASVNLINLGHPISNILKYLEPQQAAALASTNRQAYKTVQIDTFEKIIPPTDQLIKGGDPVNFKHIECIKSLTYGRSLFDSILKSKLHYELAKTQHGIVLLNNQYHYFTKDIRVPVQIISSALPVAEDIITEAIYQHMKTQTYITADKNLTQKQIDHLFEEYISIDELIKSQNSLASKKM